MLTVKGVLIIITGLVGRVSVRGWERYFHQVSASRPFLRYILVPRLRMSGSILPCPIYLNGPTVRH